MKITSARQSFICRNPVGNVLAPKLNSINKVLSSAGPYKEGLFRSGTGLDGPMHFSECT